MAWGIWKKIKEGIKKAAQWTKDHVIKPVVDGAKKLIKAVPIDKVIDTGMKVLPHLIKSAGGKAGAAAAVAQGISGMLANK